MLIFDLPIVLSYQEVIPLFFLSFFFLIFNLHLHEEYYVYYALPYIRPPLKTTLRSLSISIAKCRITTCPLCVVEPSLPLLPPPPCMLILIPPFFSPPLFLPAHTSSPVPFPLVPVSPFLGSVIPLLFRSFSFSFFLILHR